MNDDLVHRLAAIEQRLARVERYLWPAPAMTLPAPPARSSEPEPHQVGVGFRAATSGGRDLEDFLGRHGLALAGGAAVLIGLAFFVVLAASRGWLSEPVRVALSVVASGALMVAGAWLYERRGHTQAALAAAGAGIGGLFLSLTAATVRYAVLPSGLGLLAAVAVGAVATGLALRWNSRTVAGLGIGGALLAPVLVGAPPGAAVIAFLLLALAAAVAVLLWRRWQWLGLLALGATVPQLGAWVSGQPEPRQALPVLAAVAALLIAAGLGYEWRVPTAAIRPMSAALIGLNATATAALGAAVLDGAQPAGRWIAALAIAHAIIAAAALALRPQSRGGGLIMAGAALGLTDVAAGILVDGVALPVGWALSAAVLTVLAGADLVVVRRAIVVQLALAAGHVLAIEAPLGALVDGVTHLGRAVLALGALAIGVAVAAPALRQRRREPLSALVLLYLTSVAIVTVARGQGGQLALSAWWALSGLTALWMGLRMDSRALRGAGFAGLALASAKVVTYDLAALDAGYRAASFLALGVLLMAGAFAYQRVRPAMTPGAGPYDDAAQPDRRARNADDHHDPARLPPRP